MYLRESCRLNSMRSECKPRPFFLSKIRMRKACMKRGRVDAEYLIRHLASNLCAPGVPILRSCRTELGEFVISSFAFLCCCWSIESFFPCFVLFSFFSFVVYFWRFVVIDVSILFIYLVPGIDLLLFVAVRNIKQLQSFCLVFFLIKLYYCIFFIYICILQFLVIFFMLDCRYNWIVINF